MGRRATLDARPGGVYRCEVNDTHTVIGEYVLVEPPSRVVFTWGFAGSDELPPGSSTVEVRFSKEAGGTLVELVHRGLPPSRTATHAAGWRRFLDRLALAGNTSGVDPPPIG